MSPEIDSALGKVERQRERYEGAQEAAEEALTQWFEAHLAKLALRFPKRCFRADSGMGSLSVGITPGPWPMYAHHPRGEYAWIWGAMIHSERQHWGFLWEKWEELLDTFAARTGLEYVNFTRDIVVKGVLYQED
jgi:hypothetical protein